MIALEELGKRERDVLAALVYEFISTGEPVGSRTLSKKYGLGVSPATIRNTMSDLEEMGIVYQPHTSAGRLPTDHGLRIFVDGLMDIRELSDVEQLLVQRRYGDLNLSGDSWNQIVRTLSELAEQPAVVCSPRASGMVLRQLRFLPLETGQILAILVSAYGVAQSRLLRVSVDLTPSTLERIHNYLNEHIPGRTLQEAQQHLEREAGEAKSSMDKLKVQALELGRSALEDSDAEPAVIVHGQSRLVHAGSSVDMDRVRQVMELLDDQERLGKLLDATVKSEGPLIFIGGEHPFTDSAKCSVIAASYSTGPEVWGTLGVVGPLSMNYAKVIPLVGFSARLLSEPSQE